MLHPWTSRDIAPHNPLPEAAATRRGHVFVVEGTIGKLVADATIIPTDRDLRWSSTGTSSSRRAAPSTPTGSNQLDGRTPGGVEAAMAAAFGSSTSRTICADHRGAMTGSAPSSKTSPRCRSGRRSSTGTFRWWSCRYSAPREEASVGGAGRRSHDCSTPVARSSWARRRSTSPSSPEILRPTAHCRTDDGETRASTSLLRTWTWIALENSATSPRPGNWLSSSVPEPAFPRVRPHGRN